MQMCEKERRQREQEAEKDRLSRQHAERNKRALDRALAPPFVKVQFKFDLLPYSQIFSAA